MNLGIIKERSSSARSPERWAEVQGHVVGTYPPGLYTLGGPTLEILGFCQQQLSDISPANTAQPLMQVMLLSHTVKPRYCCKEACSFVLNSSGELHCPD